MAYEGCKYDFMSATSAHNSAGDLLTCPFQIAYTSIVGAVMLAAFLEWFLWLAAFLYCLVKVFQKAEHWTVRLLAVVVATLFTLLRYETSMC